MAGFANFDVDALRDRVRDAVARLAESTPAFGSPTDDGYARAAASVAEVLSDGSEIADEAAKLIIQFGEAADAVGADFGSIDRFRGLENIVGLFSEARRQGLHARRVRRLALVERLRAVLAGCGETWTLLDETRTAMRLARDECDRALDRLTSEAIRDSEEVVAAEHRLGALVPEIAHRERRLAPAADRQSAVTLAQDHAHLAGELRALRARLTGLRRSREEADSAIGTIGPLLKDLSAEIATFDVLRTRLATHVEAYVLLFAAVTERLRLDRIVPNAGRAFPASGGDPVADLLAVHARGGLSTSDIERRRSAADAAFARRFPHLVDQPEEPAETGDDVPELRPADDRATRDRRSDASTDDAQP